MTNPTMIASTIAILVKNHKSSPNHCHGSVFERKIAFTILSKIDGSS